MQPPLSRVHTKKLTKKAGRWCYAYRPRKKLDPLVNKKWNPNVNKVELVVVALSHCRTGGIMLKINTKKLGAVKVLCLEGQIINGDTEILRSAVQSASDTSDVILELSNVTIVDAHGLGVLLEVREQIVARGLRFELMNVSHQLNRILEITRLNTVFNIKPGVEFFPRRARVERVPVAA